MQQLQQQLSSASHMGTTHHVASLMMVLQRCRATAARLHASAAAQRRACLTHTAAMPASHLSLARSVLEAQGHLEQSALQQRVSLVSFESCTVLRG